MPTSPSVAAFVGRLAAACMHPYAAWRVKPASRIAILSAYAAAGYAVVLATLLML
jgi:hypothetical protein